MLVKTTYEGQLLEKFPTRTAIMKCETVMKKLPQRSKGRRPKRSIVHKLVLTPTSFLLFNSHPQHCQNGRAYLGNIEYARHYKLHTVVQSHGPEQGR